MVAGLDRGDPRCQQQPLLAYDAVQIVDVTQRAQDAEHRSNAEEYQQHRLQAEGRRCRAAKRGLAYLVVEPGGQWKRRKPGMGGCPHMIGTHPRPSEQL